MSKRSAPKNRSRFPQEAGEPSPPGEPFKPRTLRPPSPPLGLTEMEERARCRPIPDEWEQAQEDPS